MTEKEMMNQMQNLLGIRKSLPKKRMQRLRLQIR